MFAIHVDNTFAQGTDELRVEDFGTQALLDHGFEEQWIDIVSRGRRR